MRYMYVYVYRHACIYLCPYIIYNDFSFERTESFGRDHRYRQH